MARGPGCPVAKSLVEPDALLDAGFGGTVGLAAPRAFGVDLDEAVGFKLAQLAVDQWVPRGPDGAEQVLKAPGEIPAVAQAATKQKLGPADAVAKTIVAAVEAGKPKRRYMAGSGVAVFSVLAHLPAGVRERPIKAVFGVP